MKLGGKRMGALAWSVALALSVGVAAAEETSPSPWLGVRLTAPASGQEGVAVSGIFEGSPAERAGLRARDVIVSFGVEPVADLRDLIAKIRTQEPGAWMPLTVLRGDDEFDLDVRLDSRPKVIRRSGVRRGWIGVKAIDLPESLREHFGAPPEAGVMISHVAPGSPAEAAGFRLGDVVHELDGDPVRSLGSFRKLVAGGGVGNVCEFSVARDGASLVLESPIERVPPKDR